MLIQNQEVMGEGSAIPTDPQHTPTITQLSTSQPQQTQPPREPSRMDTEIPQSCGPTDNVADEAVYEERDDSLVRAATTASSLEAEQDSGNINKTRSKATLNEPSSSGTSSGVNTPRSDEDRLKLKKLIELCTKLSQRVLDLEKTKTAQDSEIAKLKKRVKKLEQKKRSRTHRLRRLYKVGSFRRVKSSEKEDMFGVNDLDGDEVIVDNVDVVKTAEETVNVVATTVSTASIILIAKPKANKVVIQKLEQGATTTTTAATTITAASTRPKAKGLVIHEQEQALTPTVSSQQPSHVKVQDKGKGKMVEPEPVKKLSKKDQLMLDEELAFNNEKGEYLFDYKTELMEESSKKAKAKKESRSKRAGEKLESDNSKKQKLDEKVEAEVNDAKEVTELK
ncbi:hypothetical protein Tco_1190315 [Tanacetum coccineum]